MNINKQRTLMPYLILFFGTFYILPFFISDTGIGMFIMVFAIPLICFLLSFLYGMQKKFFLLYSILVSILFIPSIYLFYNSSASIYIFIYGAVSLIGQVLGFIVYKIRSISKY